MLLSLIIWGLTHGEENNEGRHPGAHFDCCSRGHIIGLALHTLIWIWK